MLMLGVSRLLEAGLALTLGDNQRRRKQSRAGGGGNIGLYRAGGSISKKGTLFYFGKQAEKPNIKK